MTVVDTAAWEGAGGHVIGTTTTVPTGEDPAIDRNSTTARRPRSASWRSATAARSGSSAARCRRRPRSNDHRYGLRNYALTYSGLFLMENAIRHDVEALGIDPAPVPEPGKKPKKPKKPK